VLARLRLLDVDEVAISGITMAELQYGVAKSADPVTYETLLAQFCSPFDGLLFDTLAAETCGRMRTAIEHHGTPIGPLESLTASRALSVGVTLLPNNDREFRRVTGLRVKWWLGR